MHKIYIDKETGQRLDLCLTEELNGLSRTYINKLIREGLVYVNDKVVKPRYIVKKGDQIQIKLPVTEKEEIKPEDIPIDIIYEDEFIIVINKPKSMLVHPTDKESSGTLVNSLLYHVGRAALSSSDVRPGIVHRLDKDTTGLLVIAKDDRVYKNISQQFMDGLVERIYITLVHGKVDIQEAIIDAPIGRNPINRTRMAVTGRNGKDAITYYNVIEQFKRYTLLEVSLRTGRTHQIRVHMDYIGHPIVGDPIYTNIANELNVSTQLLHANRLAFYHPNSGKHMEFEAELPGDFKAVINLLKRRG